MKDPGKGSNVALLRNLVTIFPIVDSNGRPMSFFCDNSVAMFHTKNYKTSGGYKNSKLKYVIVRVIVKGSAIVLEHIDTYSMLTDSLTTELEHIVIKRHAENTCIVSSFDVLG